MSNPSHETVSFLAQKLSELARLTEKIKLGHLWYLWNLWLSSWKNYTLHMLVYLAIGVFRNLYLKLSMGRELRVGDVWASGYGNWYSLISKIECKSVKGKIILEICQLSAYRNHNSLLIALAYYSAKISWRNPPARDKKQEEIRFPISAYIFIKI